LEPTEGLDAMKKNRSLGDKGDKMKPHELCNGPSKLTKVCLLSVLLILFVKVLLLLLRMNVIATL